MKKKQYSNLQGTGLLNDDWEDFSHTRQNPSYCLAPCCGTKIPRVGCILIFAVILALSVVLGYFVIFPAVVQNFVNHSVLEFSSVKIQNPQSNSFTLIATSSLANVGPFSCTVGEMEVEIYYQNTKLGSTKMPSLEIVKGEKKTIELVENFQIENIPLFESYSNQLLNEKGGVVWSLRGTTVITALGIKTKCHFNKDISINGMGGLADVNILSFDLPRNSPDGGVEIYLNITQYNPSIVGIEMGDFSLALEFNGSFMGEVRAKNVTIMPGNNFLQLQGVLKPQDVNECSTFFSQYIQGIDSSVTVKGLNSSSSSPEWIKYMVSILDITTTMQGAQNLTLMKGISLETLDMDFQSNENLFTGSNTLSYFVNPFGFPIDIYEVALIMDMIFGDTLIARLDIPYQPVIVNTTTGLISLNFTGVRIQMQNETVFSDLVNDLILYPSAMLGIHVEASARVITAMGNLTLSGITIQETISVPGMNSFAYPPIFVPNTVVRSATENTLALDLEICIYNPSFVKFSSLSLPTSIYYNGIFLGNSTISPLVLERNAQNNMSAIGHVFKDSVNTDAINQFFSEFIKGHESVISIYGIPDAVSINILKKALSNLNATAKVSGMRQGLITFIHMQLSFFQFLQGIIPTTITSTNPWSADIAITKTDVKVYTSINMKQIARLNEDISKDPIFVPANTTAISKTQPVQLVGLDWEAVKALFGNILLTIDGPFYATVGNGFQTVLQFRQDNITASFTNS